MNLYYNTTAQCRVDEFNTRIAAKPILHYGACPVWELHFYSGDPSETPEAVDLSDIISWRAAVDSDWNSSTEPMCRTLAADIDMSRKAQGIIGVPVNANTQRYLTVVDGKQSVGGWFELRGFDDQGNVALVALLNITCSNSIDPTGGAEPEPVDNDTATMTWVKAEIAQQLYYQYSADGSTWHNPPMVSGTDVYFRVKHGADGTPSAAQLIPYGPQGTAPHIGANGDWYIGDTDSGVKAELSGSYIEFSAVDSSGNFTMQGDTTIPAAVLTSAGNLYPVEKRSITVDTVTHTVTLNVAPYLAYDNAATFSGTWRIYTAAYCPPSDAAYTKAAADSRFMPLYPARAISFRPAANAGTGGYIDFHHNGSKLDSYTSRIAEWNAGELTINADDVVKIVATNGATLHTKAPNGSWTTYNLEIPPGSIIKYAVSGSIPAGYLACRGAAISRTSYSRLFSLIGTTFGPGDGSTTFNLPDFTATDETGITSIIHY